MSVQDELIQKLKDDKWVVRENAADALGKIGDVWAVEPLIMAAVKDIERSVRLKAARAIVTIGKPAIIPLLGWCRSNDPAVRQFIARTLGEIGDPQAIPTLIGYCDDKDDFVSDLAIRALGNINPPPLAELCRALRWSKRRVRLIAAEILGKIGNVEAVETLILTLED